MSILLIPFLLLVPLLALYLRRPSSPSTVPQPPPHAWSFIPWLGSAVALGKDHDAFFRSTRKRLGPIFSVQVAGKRQVYITSVEGIQYVYKNPAKFTFAPIRREMQMSVFGQSSAVDNDLMESEIYPMHKRLLSPTVIPNVVLKYAGYTLSDISARSALPEYTEGKIVDLKDLIYELVFSASSRAFFGPTFPPIQSLPTFLQFDKQFPLLAAELPGFMCRDVVKAREETLEVLERFYQGILDREREGEGERAWEGVSELTRWLMEHCRKEGWGRRDIATHMLGDAWALLANAPVAAIWTIIKLVEHPESLALVRAEIAAGLAEATVLSPASPPIQTLTTTPTLFNSPTIFSHLSSSIQESLRLCNTTASIRRVTSTTVLPFSTPRSTGGVVLEKGETVVCVGRAVHMDEEVYEGAGEWRGGRFEEGEKRRVKEMGGVDPGVGYYAFGGGVSMCEGRHFAYQELRIFVITFLHYFDIEKVGAKPVEADVTRVLLGVMPIKGDAKFRLTKRG